MTRTPRALGLRRPTGRTRRPRRRAILLLVAVALVWFGLKTSITSGFGRAPRVIHVGSDWARGYVAMPQSASSPPKTRKAQGDQAALLARQRGLAIVAAGDAGDVSVVQKEGGKK